MAIFYGYECEVSIVEDSASPQTQWTTETTLNDLDEIRFNPSNNMDTLYSVGSRIPTIRERGLVVRGSITHKVTDGKFLGAMLNSDDGSTAQYDSTKLVPKFNIKVKLNGTNTYYTITGAKFDNYNVTVSADGLVQETVDFIAEQVKMDYT